MGVFKLLISQVDATVPNKEKKWKRKQVNKGSSGRLDTQYSLMDKKWNNKGVLNQPWTVTRFIEIQQTSFLERQLIYLYGLSLLFLEIHEKQKGQRQLKKTYNLDNGYRKELEKWEEEITVNQLNRILRNSCFSQWRKL